MITVDLPVHYMVSCLQQSTSTGCTRVSVADNQSESGKAYIQICLTLY